MALGFVDSARSVEHAAIKSIVFRAAALLLQFGVFRLFSLIASIQHAYTSYLMFVESPIQQFLFVLSRAFSPKGLTVLGFGILFAAAGAYDVLLWALDSPGYISFSKAVRVSTVADHLLPVPGYLLVSSEMPDQLASMNIPDVMGANLFEPGFNFTLTEQVDRGTREIVPPVLSFDVAWPRIWLDNEGFSVSLQQASFVGTEDFHCPWVNMPEQNAAAWLCNDVNKTYSQAYLLNAFSVPRVWFDESSQYVSLQPSRLDNPWSSLGEGGSTASLNQVFTVTKGRRRHTFHLVATKATMISHLDRGFDEPAVVAFLERFWGKEFGNLDQVIQGMMEAQANNKSSVRGDYFGSNNNYSVVQQTYELLSPLNTFTGDQSFSSLRLTLANLTLIRSDTLPEPRTPFGECEFPFINLAQGGKVLGTNCATSGVEPEQETDTKIGSVFLGEADVSAAFIITRGLGTGGLGNEAALNQTGVDWYAANWERVGNLLLARGFILGLSPDLVTIDLKELKPAISYLQILLVAITPVIAALAWLFVWLAASGHYQTSLLSSLCATTHVVGGPSSCKNPGFLTKPPEIHVRDDGEHMVLATSTGVFRYDAVDVRDDHEAARDSAMWETKQPLASWREEQTPTP